MGGDNSSGRFVGEKLERDQGTQHRIMPVRSISRKFATGGPGVPPLNRPRQAVSAVVDEPRLFVRGMIRQRERYRFALTDDEIRMGSHLAPFKSDRRVQLDGIGSSDGAQTIVAPGHPRNHLAIVESEDQLHSHGDLATLAMYEAHDVDLSLVVRQRHEIGDGDRSRSGLKARFQYRSARQVTMTCAGRTVFWR